MSDNAEFARDFLSAAYGPDNPLPPAWAQVLNVVGEAGEFGEAYRRLSGHARRPGSLDETAAELADVVISAYVAAERLGVDLDRCIEAKQRVVMTRGFRDPRPDDTVHTPFTDDGVTYCGFDGRDGCGHVWPCPTARARRVS